MLSRSPCGLFIKQIHDAMEKRANNELRDQDLTSAQVMVLVSLDSSPDKSAALKELERLLRVAQSTMAGIVARLEQKRFVESYGDLSDKRIKMVRLTELGERCCAQAKTSMDIAEQHLLSGLTPDEQAIFRELLQKVSEYMK